MTKSRKFPRSEDYLETIVAAVSNEEDRQVVEFDIQDFSHLCPETGRPDTARLRFRFIPREHLLETRSLNEYLWAFRAVKAYHEEVSPEIFKQLVYMLEPLWLQLYGEFVIRGTSWQRTLLTHYPETDDSTIVRMIADARFQLQ